LKIARIFYRFQVSGVRCQVSAALLAAECPV
jgi:hypothetical protein